MFKGDGGPMEMLVLGIFIGALIRPVRVSAQWVVELFLVPFWVLHSFATKGVDKTFQEAFEDDVEREL